MKRSEMILLFAGGTTLAGVYAYNETQNCRPDALGQTYCSSSSNSSSHGSYSSSGGSSWSSHSGVARGGFGGMGAAHGGGS